MLSGYANEEKEVCLAEYKKLSNTVTEKCNFGMEIPLTVPSSIHILKPMIEISYCLRVRWFLKYAVLMIFSILINSLIFSGAGYF